MIEFSFECQITSGFFEKPVIGGLKMKVEAITDLKDIKRIKKLLHDNPRDRLLFILGINTGLRVQDLLALKVSDVLDCKIGSRIQIKEKKTGKDNVIIINSEIFNALEEYLNDDNKIPDHFLFKSRKGKNSPLTTYAVMNYIKNWCRTLNIKTHVGAHTLRKTFCYQQRKIHGATWEVLSKRLNHSSPAITRRYLGVKEEEVEEILMRTI